MKRKYCRQDRYQKDLGCLQVVTEQLNSYKFNSKKYKTLKSMNQDECCQCVSSWTRILAAVTFVGHRSLVGWILRGSVEHNIKAQLTKAPSAPLITKAAI